MTGTGAMPPAGAPAAAPPPAGPNVVAAERQVAGDLVRRGVLAAPVVLLLAGVLRGGNGLASAAFALALVLANFLASAALLGWAGRASPPAFMATVLGGYLVRMAALAVALAAVRHQAWVDLPVLGVTLVVSHLGLLIWEARYVSASLAYPGLKPVRQRGS